MTHAFTALQDHKGNALPKVVGDEYSVEGLLTIDSYASIAVTTTGTWVAGTTHTFTRTSGTALPTFRKGQQIQVTDAATGGNNAIYDLQSQVGDVLSFINVAGADTGDEITITVVNEVIDASSFGLGSITSLSITGKSDKTYDFYPMIGLSEISTGKYLSRTSVELKAVTAASSAEVATTTDVGAIRVKVTGNI